MDDMMAAAADVIRNFNPSVVIPMAKEVAATGRLFLTGEGSSRIFPAKNAIATALRQGWPLTVCTEGSRQSAKYKLDNWAVLGMSNTGTLLASLVYLGSTG